MKRLTFILSQSLTVLFLLGEANAQQKTSELTAVPEGPTTGPDAASLLKPLDLSGTEEVSGLIIPRDSEGLYLRNDQGQVEVVWTLDTRIALMSNTRQFGKGLSADRLDYGIHSSDEVVSLSLIHI